MSEGDNVVPLRAREPEDAGMATAFVLMWGFGEYEQRCEYPIGVFLTFEGARVLCDTKADAQPEDDFWVSEVPLSAVGDEVRRYERDGHHNRAEARRLLGWRLPE